MSTSLSKRLSITYTWSRFSSGRNVRPKIHKQDVSALESAAVEQIGKALTEGSSSGFLQMTTDDSFGKGVQYNGVWSLAAAE